MTQILIIEDDKIMAECIARAIDKVVAAEINYCSNAITAMQTLDDKLPDLICLDILLDGPDGFSLLNELNSYPDTAQIPIVIITSLNLQNQNLQHYNVRKVLQKETMTPLDIGETVQQILSDSPKVLASAPRTSADAQADLMCQTPASRKENRA